MTEFHRAIYAWPSPYVLEVKRYEITVWSDGRVEVERLG
jgi:hypothetical protein